MLHNVVVFILYSTTFEMKMNSPDLKLVEVVRVRRATTVESQSIASETGTPRDQGISVKALSEKPDLQGASASGLIASSRHHIEEESVKVSIETTLTNVVWSSSSHLCLHNAFSNLL